MMAAATGCQHGDMARRANRERVESLQRTVATWSESEAGRPSRARRTGARIPDNLELHAKRLDLMIQRVRAWQVRDWEQWQERQPAYRHEIERRIHGKPEQIEPVAILLFL